VASDSELDSDATNEDFEWQLYRDTAGKYRFRLKAARDEIVAVSEAYETIDEATFAIEAVGENAPGALLLEIH
jgi:uncharacterized protein